jgi:hypothetical protein
MRWLLAMLLSLAFLASPQRSVAAPVAPSAPRLSDWLSILTDPALPHAWAGVWQSTNVDSNCVNHTYTGTTYSTDTLCTNQAIGGGPQVTCTGTTSDTAIDISCSGTEEIFPGCSVTYSFTLVATRSGETLQAATTSSQVFTPTLCAGLADTCTKTVTTATRIGPEPADCATPVEPDTWGEMKSRYK